MEKQFNKRKNYFIKKAFQFNFAIKFALLILVEATFIALLLLQVSKGTLTTAYYGTQLQIQKTQSFFLDKFILITLVAGIGIGLAGLIIFIYLSHRIAGPLYKFEKTLNDISNGDLSSRVHLRETDQLQNLQQPLNSLLINLDDRIKNIKKDIETASKSTSEENTKELLGNLKSKLDFFKNSK